MSDTGPAKIKLILRDRDGTLIKEATTLHKWPEYIPPHIVVDGKEYYLRTSPDDVLNPLEYVSVYAIRL